MADLVNLFEYPSALSDRVALDDGYRSLTFADLARTVASLAARLADKGVAPGDRIAIAESNRLEYPIMLLALLRLGAVACPMNIRQPAAVLAAQAKHINCTTQLVIENSHLHIPDTERLAADLQSNPGDTAPASQTDPDQPATIIFTSGTSGQPKAVLHSLGNHYYSALGSNRNLPLEPGDRWLVSLPMYHVGGLAILFRCLLGGATAHITDPGDDIASLIKRHRVTHVSMVAAQLRRLLTSVEDASALRSLKAILLGGGPTPPSLLARALELGLPVYRSYGLTETASQVVTSSRPDGSRRIILDYRRVRLGDNNEILVSGPTRFLGYVQDTGLATPFDSEGWFATGDIGGYDSQGGLVLLGRRDNQFISGGENIQPEFIENALRELPGITDAVVVPVPDTEFGLRPAAFIQGDLTDIHALKTALADRLASFQIPVAFLPWPEEYARSGIKPDRRSLHRLALRLCDH